MRIAVIGGGIAGIGAAWSLSAKHHVTLFEANERVGGHSRTLEVDLDGSVVPVDTGFIVYNERNYPNLTRFFETLDVDTEPSDMSFSVSTLNGDLEYAGRLSAMFTSRRALTDRRIWDIVRGIKKFRSEAKRLDADAVPQDMTISEYLDHRAYPPGFAEYYLMPLTSAVWSGSRDNAADMPARTILQFLNNHGLVRLSDRPQWRTVSGGSQRYVARALKEITSVQAGRGVRRIERSDRSVEVTDVNGRVEAFDQVVMATHADATLKILGEGATEAERKVLSAFRYDMNEVVLHTDTEVMPSRRGVWSAWNCIERTDAQGDHPISVSYWMNRLQNIRTTTDLIVTLNPGDTIDPDKVVDRWGAMHPQFDHKTQWAQAQIPTIQGADRVWFAGAHLGHGFHEDGLQSGLTVAASLGAPAPWHEAIVPASPAAMHASPQRIPVLT